MRRAVASILISLLVLAMAGPSAWSYPRPARVSDRPEVTFQPNALRMFRAEDGRRYWYLIYDVVNMTGEDRTWAPSMTLFTDRGEVLVDGVAVSRTVAEAIRRHVGDPLIEPRAAIIGQLRQGPAHARRGMAMWPADRHDVTELRIFVEGISPESVTIPHPVTGEPLTMRKNLHLHYLVAWDPRQLRDDPIPLHPDYPAEEHWVFR